MQGITALHWVVASGRLDAVKLLVEHDANVNAMEVDGEHLTALDYALIGDGDGNTNADIVDYLRANGALTVQGIREIAATAIQSFYRGYIV